MKLIQISLFCLSTFTLLSCDSNTTNNVDGNRDRDVQTTIGDDTLRDYEEVLKRRADPDTAQSELNMINADSLL